MTSRGTKTEAAWDHLTVDDADAPAMANKVLHSRYNESVEGIASAISAAPVTASRSHCMPPCRTALPATQSTAPCGTWNANAAAGALPSSPVSPR